MPAKPWVDDFSAGYMQRMLHLFPKQSDRDPWRNTQNYSLDKKLIRHGPLEDGTLVFDNSEQEATFNKNHPAGAAKEKGRTAA
jgi:monooxygenase